MLIDTIVTVDRAIERHNRYMVDFPWTVLSILLLFACVLRKAVTL